MLLLFDTHLIGRLVFIGLLEGISPHMVARKVFHKCRETHGAAVRQINLGSI